REPAQQGANQIFVPSPKRSRVQLRDRMHLRTWREVRSELILRVGKVEGHELVRSPGVLARPFVRVLRIETIPEPHSIVAREHRGGAPHKPSRWVVHKCLL